MLSKINFYRYKKLICSLVLIFLQLVLPPLIFAGSFEGSLQTGKDLGSNIVIDFNPNNIDKTLRDLGLGSVNEITPRVEDARSQQGNYSGYYTNPGGMSGAQGSEAGEFVTDSYERRQKFDLSYDSIFGNKCLRRDSNGKCVQWSASKDILTNTYPECEKIVIPQYGEVREETCTGELTSQSYDCETRMVVSIITEEVQGRCDQIVIDDRPGQIYAVCREYVDVYRLFLGKYSQFCAHYANCWAFLRNRCNSFGCFCKDKGKDKPHCPLDSYVISSESELPPGAQYIGLGMTDIYVKGDSGDRVVYWSEYKYYARYRPSVIERVFVSFDSTCGGNYERWINECIVSDYQKCDSNGFNCVYLVKDGERTNQNVSIQCQNFPSSIGVYSSQNCQYICDNEYEECKRECIGIEGASSCYEARTICREGCDDTYSLCEGQCATVRDSCLNTCGTNQTCRDSCQSNYNTCVSICNQNKNVCYGDCETNYQTCNSCVSQCQTDMCQTQCQLVTMDNYEICSLPDSSQGIRVNGTVVRTTPYRNYFTTDEKGFPIHWQTVFGGSGVKEGLNDWWNKVKFVCNDETGDCQALIDAGCVLYSQRCLNSDCSKYEFVYHCGDGGIKGYRVAYNCGGDIRCIGSDCVDTSYEANTDFASAAAAVEVLNQYRVDSEENRIFPGEARECQSSPKDCCRKAGGGVSVGDYINAARSVISLYSYATGGASATWTAYANAFTYVLSGGQTGTLSGLLGNTISNALGTTTSVLYTSPGVVSYEAANAIGVTVTQQGITEVTMVSAELVSALATVATVITIALVVYSILKFAYDWMFQCKKEDIITSSKLQLRLCHLVGVKKTKKFFGLITKKEKVFCCFNSILARIIHEQGRPQIGVGWGSANSPNCRGLTPEELASIDFSRVDFREYMQYVEYKTEIEKEEINRIMERIKNQISSQ